MLRILLASSSALFFGGVGAFFLFVPPLLIATVWIATVALLLTGWMVMFWLGVRPQPARPPDRIVAAAPVEIRPAGD